MLFTVRLGVKKQSDCETCVCCILREISELRTFCELAVAMVDIDSSRIYEVLNPKDPPSWTASNGSKIVQRSKTVGAVSSGHRMQNGFANYAVPRYYR